MLSVHLLELWLRIAILRAGGTLDISMSDPEVDTIDEVILFAEAINDGTALRLTTARVRESEAGHA